MKIFLIMTTMFIISATAKAEEDATKASAETELSSSHNNIRQKKSTTTNELLSRAKHNENSSVEKAEHFAQMAFEQAKAQQDINFQAEVLFYLIQLSKRQNKLYSVQLYLSKAEVLLEQIDKTSLKFELLLEIASVKAIQNKFDLSLSLVSQAIDIAKTINNNHWLYASYRQKASTLKKIKRYDQSLNFFLLAHKHAKELDYKTKIQSITELGVIYKYLNNHKTRSEVLIQGITYIKKLSDQSALPQMLIHLAQAQRQTSRYAEAIRNASKALALADEMNYQHLSADACIVLSRVYRRISSYDNALKYSQQAVSIHRKNDNTNGLAAALNATALIYTHLNEQQKAADLFQEVLNLPANSINKKYTAAALRELGRYYYRTNDNIKGLTLSIQAFELYKSISSTKGKASVKKTIGQLYHDMGETKKAIDAFHSAINDSKIIGDKWSVAENLILLAQATIEIDIVKAKKWALEGLGISLEINSKLVTSHAYDVLIIIEDIKKNNVEKQKYLTLRASVHNEIKSDDLRLKETNSMILSNSL